MNEFECVEEVVYAPTGEQAIVFPLEMVHLPPYNENRMQHIKIDCDLGRFDVHETDILSLQDRVYVRKTALVDNVGQELLSPTIKLTDTNQTINVNSHKMTNNKKGRHSTRIKNGFAATIAIAIVSFIIYSIYWILSKIGPVAVSHSTQILQVVLVLSGIITVLYGLGVLVEKLEVDDE